MENDNSIVHATIYTLQQITTNISMRTLPDFCYMLT